MKSTALLFLLPVLALCPACKKENDSSLEQLQLYLTLNQRTPQGKTILGQAILDKAPLPIIKSLIAHGASIHTHDEQDITPLLRAIESKRTEIVSLLLDSGSTFSSEGMDMEFAAESTPEIFFLLLERGAPLPEEESPWTLAVSSKNIEIIKALAKKGAPLPKNILKSLSFNHSYSPDVEILELLLKQGADPNTVLDNNNTTPLIAVSDSSNRAILIPLLLKYGADAKLKTDRGASALDLFDSLPRIVETEEVKQKTRELLVNAGAEKIIRHERGNIPPWQKRADQL